MNTYQSPLSPPNQTKVRLSQSFSTGSWARVHHANILTRDKVPFYNFVVAESLFVKYASNISMLLVFIEEENNNHDATGRAFVALRLDNGLISSEDPVNHHIHPQNSQADSATPDFSV